MTREEALARLEGTWSFELVGGRAVVRDPELLSTVAEILRERAASEGRQIVLSTSPAAAASGD